MACPVCTLEGRGYAGWLDLSVGDADRCKVGQQPG